MITIDFTYQTVSEDSALYGDFEDGGFILPGMNKVTTEDYDRQEWKPGDLRSFISFAESLGICEDRGADWFYSVDPDVDYQSGKETYYSMHIAGITESTRNRIRKLLVS